MVNLDVRAGDVFNLKGEIVFSRRGAMARTKTMRIRMLQFGVHYVAPEETEGRDILPGEVADVDEAFAQNMLASNRAVEAAGARLGVSKAADAPKEPAGDKEKK